MFGSPSMGLIEDVSAGDVRYFCLKRKASAEPSFYFYKRLVNKVVLFGKQSSPFHKKTEYLLSPFSRLNNSELFL